MHLFFARALACALIPCALFWASQATAAITSATMESCIRNSLAANRINPGEKIQAVFTLQSDAPTAFGIGAGRFWAALRPPTSSIPGGVTTAGRMRIQATVTYAGRFLSTGSGFQVTLGAGDSTVALQVTPPDLITNCAIVSSITAADGIVILSSGSGDIAQETVEGVSMARGSQTITALPNLGDRLSVGASGGDISVDAGGGAGVASFDTTIDDSAFGGVVGLWARGSASYYVDDSGAEDVKGVSGSIQVGVDRRVADWLLVGAAAFGDWTAEEGGGAVEADGRGFLAGPYAAVELWDQARLDGIAMVGRGYNAISNSAGEADYQSRRLFLSGRATIDHDVGAWRLRSSAQLAYYAEKSESFVEPGGATVESATDTLLQGRVGARVSRGFYDGALRPFVGADFVYGEASDRNAADGVTSGLDGASASALGGVEASIPGGFARFETTVDGIFSDFSAVTGAVSVRLPL